MIYGSFTQSSGSLTITDASGESDGGECILLELCWLYQGCFPVGIRAFGDVDALKHKFASNCQVSIIDTCYFQKLDRFDAISAAGAIYVKEGSFTQSGGTLTITDASSESDGGVVRMLGHPMQSIVLCFQTEAETCLDGSAMQCPQARSIL